MNEHIDELIAAYALDALDDDERALAQSHLAGCDRCRKQVGETREIVNSLPLELEPVAPDPSLKQRVLAIAAEPVEAHTQVSDEAERAGRRPIPFPRADRRPGQRILAVLAAAAVVLFAIGITIGHELQKTSPSAQHAYEQLLGKAVLHGAKVVPLRGHIQGRKARISLAVSPSGKTSLILGPTPGPSRGKIYQLWYIKSKKSPVSVGLFSPSTSRARAITLRRSARGYGLAAMTVEPAPRGSPQPTTKPFVQAPVSKL